jgi:hypothetical protein
VRRHDPDIHYHAESKRRARRFRRRQRRSAMIPMEGLIPRRIQNLPRWMVKLALKTHHQLEYKRHWGSKPEIGARDENNN